MDMMFNAPWHSSPPQHRRIGISILLAIIFHGMVLYLFIKNGSEVQPKLPDWVNLKLVAGIEQSVNKTPSETASKAQPKLEPAKSSELTKQQDPEENKASPSEAQNFVKADSRPFERENPKPFYPAAAKRRGMEGTVLLEVEVNERGKVSHVGLKKSSGYRLLDRAAIETVGKWFFIPAQKGEKPVKSLVEIPVKFELKNL